MPERGALDLSILERVEDAVPSYEIIARKFKEFQGLFAHQFGDAAIQLFVKNGEWKPVYSSPLPQRGVRCVSEELAYVDLWRDGQELPMHEREYIHLALENEVADSDEFFAHIDALASKPELLGKYRKVAVWYGREQLPTRFSRCDMWPISREDATGLYIVSSWNGKNLETGNRELRTKKMAILRAS